MTETVRTENVVTTLMAFAFSAAALFAASVRRRAAFANAIGICLGDRSLDSLNAANMRRRVTGDVFIHDAHHTAVIDHEDLSFIWNYTGFAMSECVSAMEFSIDSDSNIPFDKLDCFAYDLKSDPGLSHRIRPILIGQDGVSKKIAVPFLSPISAGERFAIRLECHLPGCMKSGVEYYTSTLSFEQEFIPTCTVQLRFVGARPRWVRLYQLGSQSELKLTKELPPVSEVGGLSDYSDVSWNLTGRSTIVYAFYRDNALAESGGSVMPPADLNEIGRALGGEDPQRGQDRCNSRRS